MLFGDTPPDALAVHAVRTQRKPDNRAVWRSECLVCGGSFEGSYDEAINWHAGHDLPPFDGEAA